MICRWVKNSFFFANKMRTNVFFPPLTNMTNILLLFPLLFMTFSPETLISSSCLSCRKFLQLINCCPGAELWGKQATALSSTHQERKFKAWGFTLLCRSCASRRVFFSAFHMAACFVMLSWELNWRHISSAHSGAAGPQQVFTFLISSSALSSFLQPVHFLPTF